MTRKQLWTYTLAACGGPSAFTDFFVADPLWTNDGDEFQIGMSVVWWRCGTAMAMRDEEQAPEA